MIPPQLRLNIPPNHVAHWKLTERGVEVEMLRFLKPSDAKSRADRPYNRKAAA